MIPRPLDQIGRTDIEILVARQVRAGRTLDYKPGLPAGTDKDRDAFLADVSSFANAAGGDLLYGVVQQRDTDGKPTGLPDDIPGLPGIDAETEFRRLDDLIRSGIRPRLFVQMRLISGFAGGPVLLLRIPRNSTGPLLALFQDHSAFFTRDSNGRCVLDVEQIRVAFALAESLPRHARQFRDERLAHLTAEETPFPLSPDHVRFILHLLPAGAVNSPYCVDLTPLTQAPDKCRPLVFYEWGFRYDLEGFLSACLPEDSETCLSYTQVFRSGAIEAVEGGTAPLPSQPGDRLPFARYERILFQGAADYLALQRDLGFQPPIFIFLSIVGLKGYELAFEKEGWHCPNPIGQDVLVSPPVLADDYSTPADQLLRPLFDSVWQAAGCPGSPSYNAEGRWACE